MWDLLPDFIVVSANYGTFGIKKKLRCLQVDGVGFGKGCFCIYFAHIVNFNFLHKLVGTLTYVYNV